MTHHALENLAKNNMSAIKPTCFLGGNEELRAIGVLASISHGEPTRSVVG